MLIGSNNSLTYLRPSNGWFKVLNRLGKCQNIDYADQYAFWGVRLFDFRLSADKNNHIVAKNGDFVYPLYSFYEILDYFNKRADAIVYITLDSYGDKSIERKFIEICNIIDTIYEDAMLCGGYRRFDNEKLYHFSWEHNNGMPTMIQPSEWSWKYRFVTKWFPMFIGKLNRKYIEQFKDQHGYLMLNYVNKR